MNQWGEDRDSFTPERMSQLQLEMKLEVRALRKKHSLPNWVKIGFISSMIMFFVGVIGLLIR